MREMHAVCRLDFTRNLDGYAPGDEKEMIDTLKTLCKRWCFQLERGEETGRLHFQGRVSLKKKSRPSTLGKLTKWHWSITSNASKYDEIYVTKEETRVAGPWSDKDIPDFIPRDIAAIEQLKPWQAELLDISQIYDERHIDVVYDPYGNSGKTTFTRYAMVYKYGQLLPFCNDFKDIMRMVMDMPTSKCYIMDMPRAINKERLYQLFGGIESVKDGYAYDDRYHFKQKIFDKPNIILFTNVFPDLELLSGDRWRIWEIVNDNLVPYDEDPLKGLFTDDDE